MSVYNALNMVLYHKLIIGNFGGEKRTQKPHVFSRKPEKPLVDLIS